MPKKLLFMLSGIAIGIALTAGVVLAGSLIPPAGPTEAGSQMYTLGQLYERLTTGANSNKATTYTEPGSDPAGTMYSLDAIMAASPERDDSDGVTADEVAAGRTFWGLRSDGWGVLTGTLTGVAGGVVMPTREEQVKAAGYYSSPIVVPGDAILSPAYIKAGVELFGVEGVVTATNVYSTFVPKSGALVTGDIGAQNFFAHVRTYNTFNLIGRLLDPTGNPLVGVNLSLHSWVRPTPFSARTDADGTFVFANLPAQYYAIQNATTGELFDAEYTLSLATSFSGGYSINQPPISSSNGVDVNLDVYAATSRTGHTITGRVTDGGGNGVPDVTIHQDRQAIFSPYAQHTAKTDAAGYYTMTVRTEPATKPTSLVVYLRPSKRGLDFTPATLLVDADAPEGAPLSFANSDFTAAATTTTYDISGRIMTRGYDSLGGVIGVPLANVILSDGTQTVTTGAAGNYVLPDVPGGVYVITPTLDGYHFSPPTISILAAPPTTTPVAGEDSDLQKGQEWPGPRFTDNNDGTITDNLTGLVWLKEGNCFGLLRFNAAVGAVATLMSGQCGLSGGTLGGQNFAGAATAATATLFGRVTDADGAVILNPLDSSQQVSISVAAGAVSSLIDESGYYTLTGVPYGPQTVTASVVGNNLGQAWETPARFEFAPAQRLVLANQSQIVEQNFVGTEVFTVTGRVYRPSPPLALAGVTVRAGDRLATTDANGYYTMTVPRGRYNFTPFLVGYSFDPTSHNNILITTNQSIADFSFATTAATGLFYGYVVDANGNPLSSAPLPDKTQSLRIYYSYRKTDGTIQSGNGLPVNSGEDMGRYQWSGIPLGAVVTVTPTLANHVFTPLTTTIVITGAIVSAPNSVARPAYDLGGRIVDGSSNPLAGVTVSNGAYTVTTNASGYYTFTSQPIGDYVLTASRAGYSMMPAAITATLSHNSLPGNWRMPNARELHSLVSFGYAAPALSDSAGAGHWSPADPFVFAGITDWAVDDPSNNKLKWWTSTEVPTTNALTVHFNSGALLWTDKGISTSYCPGDGNLLCHSYLWPVWDVPEP